MSAESRKELFTRRVTAGSRVYFFDVKQSAEGAKYLVISESRDVKGKWEHDRVMVFEEHLQPFLAALQAAGNYLGAKQKGSTSGFEQNCEPQGAGQSAKPKTSLDDIRQIHHRAYRPWTEEEDQILLARYNADCSVKDLAKFFERQKSANWSRLDKLQHQKTAVEKPQWKKERPNAGKAWSNKDDAELLTALDAGVPIPNIAQSLGRGIGVVQVRLIKLGREAPNGGVECEPF